MTDRMTRKQRSIVMTHIRGRDTGPELRLRTALRSEGVRGYRISPKDIPGSPDITFTKQRIAVFVDGCFWHRCPLCYREPSSNIEFWRQKLSRNVERDRTVDSNLMGMGWKVMRLWEHEIKANPEAAAGKVLMLLGRLCHQRCETHAFGSTLSYKSFDPSDSLDEESPH
jgi:DNA mismatch endonuclease (patch repair protein)